MPPPDRWEIYTPLGKIIEGTRLFACKVPLKDELCESLQKPQRFTPRILMSMVAKKGQKLGMVIDLTYTNKYYDGQIFEKHSIKYLKIMTAGHIIPNDDVYCTFADSVSDFIDNPEHTNTVVGVHCTHGVNRTGYFLCRYMIENLNFEPEDAIAAFGAARGHSIERENYLDDLKKRTAGKITPHPKGFVKDEKKYSNVKKESFELSVSHETEKLADKWKTRHRNRTSPTKSAVHHHRSPEHRNSSKNYKCNTWFNPNYNQGYNQHSRNVSCSYGGVAVPPYNVPYRRSHSCREPGGRDWGDNSYNMQQRSVVNCYSDSPYRPKYNGSYGVEHQGRGRGFHHRRVQNKDSSCYMPQRMNETPYHRNKSHLPRPTGSKR